MELFSDLEGSLLLPFLEEFMHLSMQFDILLIELPLSSPGVSWNEGRFNVLVEFVQQDIGKDRTHHASYNVAKKVIEFEYQEEIPRHRLRAAYGDGFKGAPLRCQMSGEGAFPQDARTCDGQATQALSISGLEASAIGGACHV